MNETQLVVDFVLDVLAHVGAWIVSWLNLFG